MTDHFEREHDDRILAYACDPAYRQSNSFLGKTLLASDDLPAGTVLIAPDTEPHRLNTEQFARLFGVLSG